MGDMNAVYRESDISPHPEFWKRQGDQTVADGDKGFGGTIDNERRRLRHILEFGELSDTFTPPSGRRLEAKWIFRGEGKFHGKGMKLDYIFESNPNPNTVCRTTIWPTVHTHRVLSLVSSGVLLTLYRRVELFQ